MIEEKRISLPKWPFYLGDMVLIGMGLVIFLMGGNPQDEWILFWSVFCVVMGALIFVIPYIIEYKDRVRLEEIRAQSVREDEVSQLKAVVNSFVALADEREEQMSKQDRYMMIQESLLKRMEARLRGESFVQSELVIPEESMPEKDTLVEFDEEGHEEDLDIELEMDASFLDEDEESDGDGVTTIVANVQMGIGSKPFIRGEGGGLSWDEGVPMEYISIGKWTWLPSEETDVIKYRIFKNDALPEDEELRTIEAGKVQEIHPEFT